MLISPISDIFMMFLMVLKSMHQHNLLCRGDVSRGVVYKADEKNWPGGMKVHNIEG